MANIAVVLKAEIARIARKEVKAQADSLKQSTASYRREIAALKRRIQVLETQLRKRSKTERARPRSDAAPAEQSSQRFSAKGFASLRKRLGLSANDLGTLIGASALSVYKWEQGKARPRAKYVSSIASIRTLGKREATRWLAATQ